MNIHDLSTPNRNLDLLFPPFLRKMTRALDKCLELGFTMCIFEGYRTPERQDYLYEQGRTRPGELVTNRKAWGSWHQYSCASDIALYRDGKWSWDFKYDDIKGPFLAEGLESLHPFENAHWQLSGGLEIGYAKDLVLNHGLQRLWLEIAEKIK